MVDSVLNKDEALIKSVAILKKRWTEKAPFTAMVCGSGRAKLWRRALRVQRPCPGHALRLDRELRSGLFAH